VTNPLRDGVCSGEKRFNAFLAEFTDAWLSATGLAGGLRGVILIIPLQSLIVRCGGAGRIETAAAGIYEGTAAKYIAGAAEQDNHQ
jgi:hypothetical protein